MPAAKTKPASGAMGVVEAPRRQPAPCWSEWSTKRKPRSRPRTSVNPKTERTAQRSPADSRYWCARQQWTGRLGNTGRKMGDVSDAQLIRDARAWVDWRWTEYRQLRAAMANNDVNAMDDCVCITQTEPPDSPRKNYEARYQELVDAVAARRKSS